MYHDTLDPEQIQAWLYDQADEFGPSWSRVLIKVFIKRHKKVIPLPRPRVATSSAEPELSFSQLMHYVSQTNHKNLWKEAFKKYLSGSALCDSKSNPVIGFVSCESMMREIILRTYGCPIIRVDVNTANTLPDGKSKKYEPHINILPAVCAIETKRNFLLIHQPYIAHSLEDCVTFSPALLGSSYMKPLFVIYQLIQAMRTMHDRGMVLGDITLGDILITDNLWIQIVPHLEDNVHDEPRTESQNISATLTEPETPTHLSGDAQEVTYLSGSEGCSPRGKLHQGVYNRDRTQGRRPADHESRDRKSSRCDSDVVSCELKLLCELWLRGQLSNFDYLMALNRWAGRRYSDPTCHYVVPWVTDFTHRNGANWRDLSRSKFRLNKGDRQLDLTYDTTGTLNITQVPHHVSDVLSEITYCVYLARRTPRSVLCRYVRSKWVPAEYPSSIQRLQEWTPDECIPEFYTDPTVFQSIHEDLSDLEIPPWAVSPQDFIDKHREALESLYVSERLHHWIDLTFGYKTEEPTAREKSALMGVNPKPECLDKPLNPTSRRGEAARSQPRTAKRGRGTGKPCSARLSGAAAVKAKNVCLQLVDSHTALTKNGVVQLFAQPHPQRPTISPFWGKTPPKLHPILRDRKKGVERTSEDEGHSSGFEEEDTPPPSQSQNRSPLALSRLLSRSKGSLLTPNTTVSSMEESPSSRERSADPQRLINNGGSPSPAIILPKEYNPVGAIQAVESQHGFLSRTFHQGSELEWYGGASASGGTRVSYMQVVAGRRIREMQVLGCLVVELFLASKLRALGSYNQASFEQRLEACHCILARSGDSLPRCVKYAVSLLLQVNLNPEDGDVLTETKRLSVYPFRYPTITSQGLPPPSAHQLLQPLLSSAVFPFPKHFSLMFKLLETVQSYNTILSEANLLFELDTDDSIFMESELKCRKFQFIDKVAECQVKTVARELVVLLPQMSVSSSEGLDILVSFVKHLLEEPVTAVMAAWHLFEPMAVVLGPRKTSEYFLSSLIKLYDYGTHFDNALNLKTCNKHMNLYHRSFLLQLVVRLGLKTFLENFVTPLVEAVGGYKDVGDMASLDQHHRGDLRSKGAHLKSCDLDELPNEGDVVLSPLDEDSSADSDVNKVNQEDEGEKEEAEDCVDNSSLDKGEEPEVFSFENEDSNKESPTAEAGETPLYNLMDHLELNLPQRLAEGDDNVSLDFQDEANTTLVDEMFEPAGEALLPVCQQSECDVFVENFSPLREEKLKRLNSQCKVSDMSMDSILWLSHRLGPVLTSRHLSRNLLRMLTLCYLGNGHLNRVPVEELVQDSGDSRLTLSITNTVVVGDRIAEKVLECLSSIAALYGEQLILLQYLPHIGELIALCKRKLTPNLEAGLVGALALLRHIVPYLSDSALMDQLQDVILKNILHPSVRLVSTTKLVFPSGQVAREAVATKFVDVVYLIAQRIGQEMSRKNLAVPSLQRFFLCFDKAYERPGPEEGLTVQSGESSKESLLRSTEDSNYLEIRRDGTIAEWRVKGSPIQISHVRVKSNDSADSFSPPPPAGSVKERTQDPTRLKAVEELKKVFTPQLAHSAYLPFVLFLGDTIMGQSLKNEEFIRDLCFKYEQDMQVAHPLGRPVDVFYLSDYLGPSGHLDIDKDLTGSFGSNVAVIGNRIDLQRPDIPSLQPFKSSSPNIQTSDRDFISLISRKMDNTNRHLHGNWLAYWEHEIGRAEKDTRFNFKQIKLQTFSGHTNSVRAVHVLNNENSFLSGGRDKTVKLWSLRSQGDGNTVSHCHWTYTGHRKSVVGITFLESLRLVASCDYGVHIWDPFMGAVVGTLESSRHPQVNVLRAMPPPNTTLLAATTDVVTLRLIDARTCSFVNELKVSVNPAGYIRCVTVGPSGHWVAVGQSSGCLTILDIRTGMILASWKGHEGEVLQLVAVDENRFVSSSLDQSVSVWSASDGKLLFNMKGPTEPVHCLSAYGTELISGTTANRIGVHTAVDDHASFSSTRLRSDTFRGVLTTMAVLPVNKLLLLGADSGNISLLC
uniref:BEACH domain-containing protein n=1 Tax=Timema shepardi TaxID=629360 RepID=A0A7R9ASQ9_TIMSH|nr:unnamed protein product [Timema shepardi]